MRKFTALIAVMAIAAAGYPSTPVRAQARLAATGTVVPTDPMTIISSTVNAFPSAGDPLKQAISDLIVKNPELASSIANYLRSDPPLTPEQKQAVVAGLSDALNRLGITAQAAGLDPWMIALLVGLAGGAGYGLYELSRSNNTASPN